MIERKINNKIYYELICEKCNDKFRRRKDEHKKNLEKCDNRILCFKCMKARKYENLTCKTCTKCKKEKEIAYFYKRNLNKNNYCSQCKECMNKSNKKYNIENNEIIKKRQKSYREKNKEKIKIARQNWKNKNKDSINEYKRNLYHKRKKETYYKITIRIRNLIYKAFERKGYKKNTKTEKILGCEFSIFIKHLLQTFEKNYRYEWDGKEPVHIDHIIPLSTANTEKEILKLNHYTNLQLLKEKDNLHKSNKLNWELRGEE